MWRIGAISQKHYSIKLILAGKSRGASFKMEARFFCTYLHILCLYITTTAVLIIFSNRESGFSQISDMEIECTMAVSDHVFFHRKVVSLSRAKIHNDISAEEMKINSESSDDLGRTNIPEYRIDTNETSYRFCHLLNISSCEVSELESSFVLAVYNPLAREVRNSYIRLPVSTPVWHVQGPEGKQ